MGLFVTLAAVGVLILIIRSSVTVRTSERQPGEPPLRVSVVWPNGNVTRWPRNG
jgi:hypothetical protein